MIKDIVSAKIQTIPIRTEVKIFQSNIFSSSSFKTNLVSSTSTYCYAFCIQSPVAEHQFENSYFESIFELLTIMTKTSFDLTAHIDVALVLARNIQIPQVVQSYSTVIGSNEDFVLSRHRFDSCYFSTDSISTAGRSHMDLSVIFQAIGDVEYTSTIVGADDGELAVLTEICCRYQFRIAFNFVPNGYLQKTKITDEDIQGFQT